MLYILLPNTHIIIYKDIGCYTKQSEPPIVYSPSLKSYLYEIKNKIDNYEIQWDNYKKYTNPYEYINTVIPNKNKTVSAVKPLSRSYYKMIELVSFFNLCHYSSSTTFESSNKKRLNSIPIKSFHLAEGPGGFIEALVHMRKNENDTYVGMTILDNNNNDSNIPAWKKSKKFLNDNKNVYIESGADKTGNILSLSNFEHCCSKYGSTMDIITADGGFDFSNDFNGQEKIMTKLLYGQVCYALCMQKHNGSFILKIFDCFMENTIDLIYILSAFYKDVYITKPQTSRYANSEKYVVCKNFLFTDCKDFYNVMKDTLKNTIETNEHIHRFLKIDISRHFKNKVEEYNAISGQQQMETIQNTLNLIINKTKTDKLDSIIKTNVSRCVKWCEKHNVEVNNFTSPSINSFKLSSSPPDNIFI
jgi:23S rRNA U2552 (ribose-2'-O)-methylase RlmE/FtsJ